MTELEQKIINAAIEAFSVDGLRFTMDDLAKRLRISKKTLYAVYPTKEDMMLAVADASFADIKASERAVAADTSLGPVERLRAIMGVLPDRYRGIGLSSLYPLKDKYPRVYERVSGYLDGDWDATIAILNEGVEQGLIRPISVPIFKTMFESTLAAFMERDVLVKNGITYEEAMQQTIDILLNGIVIK